MSRPESSPELWCPAIRVPDFEPCPARELDPLIAWIAADAPVAAPTAFPRGTALPDGRLDLCKQALGVDGALRVLGAIDENRQIRSLLLGTDGLGDRGAEAAAALIRERRAPRLETLYLGCNHIESSGVAALAEALAAPDCPVRALWLKRNPVGPAGAEHLAELLRRRPELELLDLTNARLGDAGVERLAEALIDQADQARGLLRLLLGANGVGPRGAAKLAELLARSPHLRELGLAVSRLGDAGAGLLAEGLAQNHSLERLDLASCAIAAPGLEALVAALRGHPGLVELDLGSTPSTRVLGERDNELGDRRGGELLADWLAEDPPLRRLRLQRAGIRSRGVLALLDGLDHNRTLIELVLGKYVARRLKRRVSAQLDRNRAAAPAELLAGPPAHVAAILSVYRNKR